MNKDGGPAFPALHSIDGNWVKEPLDEFLGMSLRDYFASQALSILIPQYEAFAENARFAKEEFDHVTATAKAAYKYADAMLKARGE